MIFKDTNHFLKIIKNERNRGFKGSAYGFMISWLILSRKNHNHTIRTRIQNNKTNYKQKYNTTKKKSEKLKIVHNKNRKNIRKEKIWNKVQRITTMLDHKDRIWKHLNIPEVYKKKKSYVKITNNKERKIKKSVRPVKRWDFYQMRKWPYVEGKLYGGGKRGLIKYRRQKFIINLIIQ